jgi:predicted transposase/invertase (TIGR01784 family)
MLEGIEPLAGQAERRSKMTQAINEPDAMQDSVTYSLRNDIIFKYVFGHEKNEKILRALLNAILGLEGDARIGQLSFLNPMNLKEYLKDKFTTLDVKAKDLTGKRYNIEMQVKVGGSYIARAIYYHDKLFSAQLVEGDQFTILKRTVSISILNRILFPGESDLHNIYRYANIKSARELTDIKELHFIELPKFTKEKPRQLMTKFEKWLYVMKYGERYMHNAEELPATLKTEEEIVMALDRMDEALSDEMVRELMEHRQKARFDEATRLYEAREEGERIGMERGMEKGMEKGMEEERIKGEVRLREERQDIARKLLKEGMDREKVKVITGLSDNEMETL